MSASAMSHEWCEVSLKIDKATAVTMSRRGARGHRTKRKDETIHTTTWTTHHQTPQRSTSQHSTSWRSATDATLPGHREHTGGSWQDPTVHVKASVFCNVSARSKHFVNVDVVLLPVVCDSFCVSAFSLGQGSRSFCHELYEQSTVMFCESGRDACFAIVCILCADHVFWYPWFPCRDFNSCVFFFFGLHANILGSMCC